MGVSECAQAWHGMVSRVRCLDDDGRVPTVGHSPVLLVELEGLLYPRGGFVGLLLPRWGLAGGSQPPVLEDRARLPIELLRNEVAQVRLHHGAPLNRTLTPPSPRGGLSSLRGALAPSPCALASPHDPPTLGIRDRKSSFSEFLGVPANWHGGVSGRRAPVRPRVQQWRAPGSTPRGTR